MIKYSVTSSNFSGEVYYTFDDEGILCKLEVNANVLKEHRMAILKATPIELSDFLQMPKNYPTMRIDEVPTDLSFDTFWKAYNYKVSKKDAEKAWKQTSEAHKVLALKAIKAYDKWLATKTQPKVYPSTYLNKERYHDDFK